MGGDLSVIVTAMLSWFDEPPELLRQAVRGAATICDRVVAADGAYDLVPDKRGSSPHTQRKAISQTAAECGMEVEFLRSRIWEGQVAKRNAVLQVAKNGSDWVMTLDADWKISGDRIAIREQLRHFLANDYEQVQVNFVTPDDPSRPLEQKAANVWHIGQMNTVQQLAFIYRVMPKMEYRKNHWSIYCENEEGRKLGLFGANNFAGCGRAKTAYLAAPHVFEHRCLFRDKKRVERNSLYIMKRDDRVKQMGYET